MNPNWDQLRQWALSLDPTNQMHVALLRDCARTIGVSDNGAFDRVRQRVLGHIAAQADQTAQATYTPLGWTPPAPVQPAQPQPAAPAVATPPAATTPQAQTPPVAPVATAPARTVQQPAAARRPLPNWVWPLIVAAGITAAAVIGLIFALRYDNGSNGAAVSSISVSGSSGQSAQQPAGNANGNNGANSSNQVQQGGGGIADKCEWLRGHFPQSTVAVQALGAKLANVPQQRIATHLFRCDATNTVFDGFIVLGPGEGYPNSFTIAVLDHGAVDSYPGATFTGNNQRIGAETIRATSGKVTATRATYWPWLDEDPPSAQAVSSATQVPTAQAQATTVPAQASTAPPVQQQPAAPAATQTYTGPAAAQQPSGNVTAPQCVDPTILASSHGWTNLGFADQKYGGLRIQLSSADTLPDKWEALTTGGGIHESDANRQLPPGTWTIYPPFVCREVLGYSK